MCVHMHLCSVCLCTYALVNSVFVYIYARVFSVFVYICTLVQCVCVHMHVCTVCLCTYVQCVCVHMHAAYALLLRALAAQLNSVVHSGSSGAQRLWGILGDFSVTTWPF